MSFNDEVPFLKFVKTLIDISLLVLYNWLVRKHILQTNNLRAGSPQNLILLRREFNLYLCGENYLSKSGGFIIRYNTLKVVKNFLSRRDFIFPGRCSRRRFLSNRQQEEATGCRTQMPSSHEHDLATKFYNNGTTNKNVWRYLDILIRIWFKTMLSSLYNLSYYYGYIMFVN